MEVTSRVGVEHPLDPLTAGEITAAVAILRQAGRLGPATRVHWLQLREPAKDVVLGFEPGSEFKREVLVVVRDRELHSTSEAVVSLTDGTVSSWIPLRGVQPPITMGELGECEAAVKADPAWREAMRARGVEDFELAMVDPWPLGNFGPEDDPDQGRHMLALTWMRVSADDNGYARPVENLIARVDLDTMRVLGVEEHGVVPIPERSANYRASALSDPVNFPYQPKGRPAPKPLDIVQPDGPTFTVDGHQVEWERWRFRVGFTQREGLVLHTIEHQDDGAWRPIVYRASLSEMYVPYADPNPTQYRKNVFDMGEFGLGMWTNSLELGCDCLGEIRYFDAVVADDAGNPVPIHNAVCMHEEDAGILWKHYDYRTGEAEVRRSRRLVISSICTVGNYEYAFYWYLSQDGGIEYEIKLTGVISNGAIAPGETPSHGTVVAPGVYGPNHQHFFCARLDMSVDGLANSVYEVDTVADPPGPENPNGNCWRVRETLLDREGVAHRAIDPLSGRYWKVVNPAERNAHGAQVAYKLLPGDNVGNFSQPGAPALARAGFIAKHLWVTAYDPDQLYAAGTYPNQHPGGAGLPAYVAGDRPLEGGDVVVWYTFGAHHVVRPEDWPVMPVTRVGFHLKPAGFFDHNPAMDLPPPDHCGHGE